MSLPVQLLFVYLVKQQLNFFGKIYNKLLEKKIKKKIKKASKHFKSRYTFTTFLEEKPICQIFYNQGFHPSSRVVWSRAFDLSSRTITTRWNELLGMLILKEEWIDFLVSMDSDVILIIGANRIERKKNDLFVISNLFKNWILIFGICTQFQIAFFLDPRFIISWILLVKERNYPFYIHRALQWID